MDRPVIRPVAPAAAGRRGRFRWRQVAPLAAATILLAGCATSIQGSPAIDPAAASALAAASTTMSSPAPTTVTSSTVPTDTPIPPVAPSTSDGPSRSDVSGDSSTAAPPPAIDSTAPGTAADVVHGVPVGDIVTALGSDPVVADDDARSAADPGDLTGLDDQVTDARKRGLDIWVVLIGHDVDGELTDVSDAVAKGVGGTAVVVTTGAFAVSSKQFSSTELQKAEDAASSASSSVEAASILVGQFRSIAAARATAPSGSTAAPTTGPTGSTGAGGLNSFPTFQTADHSVGCMITDGTVRCDLQVKPTFTPPKNPHPGCNGVYGQSITMSKTGKAAFGCISDTVYDPHAPVLEDGGETSVGDVMCFVDGPEVSCFNLTSAHGFYLGRGEYGVF